MRLRLVKVLENGGRLEHGVLELKLNFAAWSEIPWRQSLDFFYLGRNTRGDINTWWLLGDGHNRPTGCQDIILLRRQSFY